MVKTGQQRCGDGSLKVRNVKEGDEEEKSNYNTQYVHQCLVNTPPNVTSF